MVHERLRYINIYQHMFISLSTLTIIKTYESSFFTILNQNMESNHGIFWVYNHPGQLKLDGCESRGLPTLHQQES